MLKQSLNALGFAGAIVGLGQIYGKTAAFLEPIFQRLTLDLHGYERFGPTLNKA
ncbi:MAG: hypothetical protein HC860_16005 [Alkalinema sp. RU_4_3]|nr:hypothetical protein [Alkalinema sp. RU_4_3]